MFRDMWLSFNMLSTPVKIWVMVVLFPLNMLSLAFLDEELGPLVAILAIGGMTPNVVILFLERGFSKALSIPHLPFWIPLVFIIAYHLMGVSALDTNFLIYLAVLLVIDTISLYFDVIDTVHWFRGDRAVSRPE